MKFADPGSSFEEIGSGVRQTQFPVLDGRSSELVVALIKGIRRIGLPGNTFYTERQLYYEVCRQLGTGRRWLSAALLGCLPEPPVSYESFSQCLHQYIEAMGRPPGLIRPERSVRMPLVGREPDLADYGMGGVLVCQHQDLCVMLLANNMHMECGCAILGPEESSPLPDCVCAMLVRSIGSLVYILHDATQGGLSLVLTIHERLELPRGVYWSDVGLRPEQARRMRLFAIRGAPPGAGFIQGLGSLSRWERRWLKAGWSAEVAAIRPVDLLRLLYEVIVRGKSSLS